MGWSFLREPAKHEPGLRRQGGIPVEDVEPPSGKSIRLIAEILR